MQVVGRRDGLDWRAPRALVVMRILQKYEHMSTNCLGVSAVGIAHPTWIARIAGQGFRVGRMSGL